MDLHGGGFMHFLIIFRCPLFQKALLINIITYFISAGQKSGETRFMDVMRIIEKVNDIIVNRLNIVKCDSNNDKENKFRFFRM